MDTSRARYAMSFPALAGDVVTQGHADYCATEGHATHSVGSVVQGYCPRCGAKTEADPKIVDIHDAYAIAAQWQSPGTIGSQLAAFASGAPVMRMYLIDDIDATIREGVRNGSDSADLESLARLRQFISSIPASDTIFSKDWP